MTEFTYTPILAPGQDTTDYRLLTPDHVSVGSFEGNDMLKIEPEALTLLAEEAFRDVSYLLRPSHLAGLKKIMEDPESSENDRMVALAFLKNAVISAQGVFPMCQDTGTAIVMGKKGQGVWTGFSDEEALSRGVFNAYVQNPLRYSQNSPLDMFRETNTGSNLPAQIDIAAVEGNECRFLFIAKGGGSANKTFLFQETKSILSPGGLETFFKSKLKKLGTSACPPYHLAVVVGGTSAEFNLKTVKLASAGYLDGLPDKGGEAGAGFRDRELEGKILSISRDLGIGAQFGGKYFCHDVRVVRLPRHGASCPVGIGVSCSADRNIKGKITRDGVFLERLETDPAAYLPGTTAGKNEETAIDLNRPMNEIREKLSALPVAARVSLSGPIIVARDIAHAKFKDRLDQGLGLPDYLKDHIIYYAGPAKTPGGFACGSLGPTTAGRMDPYIPRFQAHGASLVTLAKGNRSKGVTESCEKHGGFYLGSIGGAGALLGKECVEKIETVEYPELGMEAVFKITVKDFPAFVIVDDKGNDFFESLLA
ncbi:fumarate hydratase (fumarase A), aerobic Class I [Candidatus Desulfarcum epimagneticum]|uniref:Fumarate hydratase class I n=1 Tax=uncultured Desulfobacteraceae bacterium TaxID=218296 RepID=A0A484HLI8_9BACT|nr:fumarate hydratase (fumarase A), aerobic Class I [uncultured Desulfobacteraceae bacterium]